MAKKLVDLLRDAQNRDAQKNVDECGNCRHGTIADFYGYCLRYPPTKLQDEYENGRDGSLNMEEDTWRGFPITFQDNLCGEYAAREPE